MDCPQGHTDQQERMTSLVGHYCQEAVQEVADCRMMPQFLCRLMGKITPLATTHETFRRH